MTDAERIRCRSRKAPDCYHGELSSSVYGESGSMADDGLWDGDSVVCDACYEAIGFPSIPVEHPHASEYGPGVGKGPGG